MLIMMTIMKIHYYTQEPWHPTVPRRNKNSGGVSAPGSVGRKRRRRGTLIREFTFMQVLRIARNPHSSTWGRKRKARRETKKRSKVKCLCGLNLAYNLVLTPIKLKLPRSVGVKITPIMETKPNPWSCPGILSSYQVVRGKDRIIKDIN